MRAGAGPVLCSPPPTPARTIDITPDRLERCAGGKELRVASAGAGLIGEDVTP